MPALPHDSTDRPTGPTRPIQGRSDRTGRFARSFPSLRNAPGLDPWDPAVFAHWASNAQGNRAALHAARFVLQNVWGHVHDVDALARSLGLSGSALFQPFDVADALDAWDDEHRDAFMRWTDNPFSD